MTSKSKANLYTLTYLAPFLLRWKVIFQKFMASVDIAIIPCVTMSISALGVAIPEAYEAQHCES
jgi:hypothetical protein